LIAALAAWWVYVFGCKLWAAALANNHLTMREQRENVSIGLTVVLMIGAIIMATVRITLYRISERFPPISLWGRIRTFRWIIPGFDRIFVAPVVIIVTALAAPRTLLDWGYNPPLAHSISAGLAVAVALLVGPTTKQWTLTGSYRILPGVFGNRPQNMI
jgi:hypothetical protein